MKSRADVWTDFARTAMHALVTGRLMLPEDQENPKGIAKASGEIADAMIAEGERRFGDKQEPK